MSLPRQACSPGKGSHREPQGGLLIRPLSRKRARLGCQRNSTLLPDCQFNSIRLRIHSFLRLTAVALSAVALAAAAEEADFVLQIKPLIEATCINCHNGEKAEGKYRMDTKECACGEAPRA